jgi:hypothetical protein
MSATHTVRLWLANTEASYREWTEKAQECYDHAEATEPKERMAEAKRWLADKMKDDLSVTDWPGLPGMYVDLLSHRLSEVDWEDVADDFMESVTQDEEDEEAGEEEKAQ